MLAHDLISSYIAPLRLEDTGQSALIAMSDYYVKHLPVVDERKLLHIISEQDVLDHPLFDTIAQYGLHGDPPNVKQTDHLFEIMRVMAENEITTIPVVNEDNLFEGIITQETLLQYYARSFSVSEPGSVIVLEMRRRDYALSEISRIVESENTQILSSFISSSPDFEYVYVTIKLNNSEIQRIKSSFERFGYHIQAVYMEHQYYDKLKERYDSLMNYLNV